MNREIKDTTLGEPISKDSQEPVQRSAIQIPIDETMQKVLTEVVCEDYETALTYRNNREYGVDDKGVTLKFDEWYKKLKDLYYGKREPKTVPWKFCSNRSMKIAMAIIEMLHSRMYAAVWNENLIRWRPGGVEDVDKAARINRLMNWWVRVKDYMGAFFDKWVKVAVAWGEVVTELGWEVKEYDTGEVDVIDPIDPMTGQPNPNSQTENRIRREENTTHRIVPREDILFQPNTKSIESDPVIIKYPYLYSQLQNMERNGSVMNVEKLKEYVDLKIQLPEGDVPEEKKESIRQIRRRNISCPSVIWYGHYDVDNDGFEEDIRLLVDPVNKVYLGGVLMTNITKKGTRPIDVTKFNDRLDDVDGPEGLGILEQVKELAEEVDACFNQLTDANSLSILRPGFYDPAGDLDAPTLKLAPNKISPVSNPTKNIYFPDIQIDITRLLNAIRLVLEFIERLTGASSYVMGKESEIVGGSGTATRTQAIMQSAEQRFSTPAQRLRAGAARVLTLLLDQIQLNIPDGLETRVLGEGGEPIFQDNELTQEGISGKFDAWLLEDSTMGDKNMERQLSDLMYNVLMQNPLIASDPAKVDKVTRDFITSYKSETEADEILGPKPPAIDTDSPEVENTLMVQGEFNKVRALLTENHIYHMMVHKSFLASPTLATLPPALAEQVAVFNQNHIQEHAMMMQQQMAMAQQAVGGPGGQTGQATPASGNAQGGGMETGSGPLGQVLNEKRKGESSAT